MSRFISFICETVCSCYGNMNAAELMRNPVDGFSAGLVDDS